MLHRGLLRTRRGGAEGAPRGCAAHRRPGTGGSRVRVPVPGHVHRLTEAVQRQGRRARRGERGGGAQERRGKSRVQGQRGCQERRRGRRAGVGGQRRGETRGRGTARGRGRPRGPREAAGGGGGGARHRHVGQIVWVRRAAAEALRRGVHAHVDARHDAGEGRSSRRRRRRRRRRTWCGRVVRA